MNQHFMQARPRDGDSRWYNPDRDVVWTFPGMIEEVIKGLPRERWQKWFPGFLDKLGLTDYDLNEVAEAYARYLQHCCDEDIQQPNEALERAGWFETKQAAQAAFFLKMGQVYTRFFFTGVRQVTPAGEKSPLPFPDVKTLLQQTRQDLQATWWQRLKGGLQRCWDSLRNWTGK